MPTSTIHCALKSGKKAQFEETALFVQIIILFNFLERISPEGAFGPEERQLKKTVAFWVLVLVPLIVCFYTKIYFPELAKKQNLRNLLEKQGLTYCLF